MAGGGLGGLCLAQGLLKAGADVTGAGAARNGDGLVAAVGDYERQMRDYGYAAVAESRQAEAETGMRRNRLKFWLYRRMAGPSA